MPTFVHMLDSVAWEAVVKTLLHSLWQGAALSVLAFTSLRYIAARNANLRYGVTVAALTLLLIASMGTFQWLSRSEPTVSPLAMSTGEVSAGRQSAGIEPARERPKSTQFDDPASPAIGGPPSRILPNGWAVIALVWLAGTAVMLGRALWLLRGASRLRRNCEIVTGGMLVESLDALRVILGIRRRVRLAVGDAVRVPAVFGVVWPIVLVPLSMVSELSPAQLRMILAHELAHVRRHDYLVNLLQLLIEALLFFNPAAWWMSRQIRIEREACCDALAIRAAGGGAEDYVRSLADVMAAIVRLSQPGLALTPAVTGDGDVVERARRVLSPAGRPPVRLSWYSLAGASVIATVLLTGMWRGTQAAVEVAEKLLTSAERVEKVAELQKEIGPGNSFGRDVERDTAELSGRVRTSDGQPLPRPISVNSSSQGGSHSTWSTIGVDKEGKFSQKTPTGVAGVWVDAMGYAPAFSEFNKPVVGVDGVKRFPPIELVLSKGFTGVVRAIGPNGSPTAGAVLEIAYQSNPADNSNFVLPKKVTADGDGIARFPFACDRNARITIDTPGYQFDRVTAKLDPNRSTEVRVVPAKPTTGVVVDAKTGQPIAGAKLDLINRSGFESQTWYPQPEQFYGPSLGQTDAAGRFLLDTLRDDSTYVVRVKAPGYGMSIITDIRAGMANQKWLMNPPRPIRVELVTEKERMPKTVSASNPLKLSEGSHDYVMNLPVKMIDGVGVAVLEDPIPGTALFAVDGQSVRVDVDVDGSPAPVKIELRGKSQKAAKLREVIVKMEMPAGSAEPKGRIRIDYLDPANPRSYTPRFLELKNGEARVEVPVPTKFRASQGELVGYWIADNHSDTEIVDDDKPFVLSVAAHPAGAAYGVVFDSSGKPMTEYFAVSLVTVKHSEGVAFENRPDTLQPYNGNDHSGKYLLSPLVPGGTYRLLAAAKERVALSDAFVVDAAHPIHEIPLRFVEGISYEGRLLDPSGKPRPATKVLLEMQTSEGSFSRSTDARTDANGVFRFDHVNPDAGTYSLNVLPSAETQGHRSPPIGGDGKVGDVQLVAGLSARGKVIEAKTGKPMPSLHVRIFPKAFDKARYTGSIECETDQHGEFIVRGMEPIEYQVMIDDSYSPTAVFTKDAAGNVTSVTDSGGSISITGGQSEPIEVQRIASPWR